MPSQEPVTASSGLVLWIASKDRPSGKPELTKNSVLIRLLALGLSQKTDVNNGMGELANSFSSIEITENMIKTKFSDENTVMADVLVMDDSDYDKLDRNINGGGKNKVEKGTKTQVNKRLSSADESSVTNSLTGVCTTEDFIETINSINAKWKYTVD